MVSARCDRCGFVGYATSAQCKACGRHLSLPVVQDFTSMSRQDATRLQASAAGVKQRKGLAVASLVLGVAGLFTFGILFIGALVGAVLGVAALIRSNRRPDVYGGRGLAVGGVVLNGLALLVAVPLSLVAAVALPNLLAARRAANEASALRTVHALVSAEAAYANAHGGKLARFEELRNAHLLDSGLEDGEERGYRFDVTAGDEGFVVLATPVNYPSTGVRSFFYSSDDRLLRAADHHGARASSDTPPLKENAATHPAAGSGESPAVPRATPETPSPADETISSR